MSQKKYVTKEISLYFELRLEWYNVLTMVMLHGLFVVCLSVKLCINMPSFRFMKKKKTEEEDFQDDHNVVIYRTHLYSHSSPLTNISKYTRPPRKKISLADGTLFEMCMKYVTLNHEKLDSLLHFPEMIGKVLFDYMLSEEIFSLEEMSSQHCESKFRLLKIFSAAYHETFLSSLSLCCPGFSNMSRFLECFIYIEELDLSNQTLTTSVIGVVSSLTRQVSNNFLLFY